MAAGFFTIHGRPIMAENWGDYGDILQHGMAVHLPEFGGRLSLERTGPYIPPVTLPGIGDIVLTSAARELLESSRLSGFSFVPVEKTLIVELRWEAWNLDADEPSEFPESGEPEDYVLGKPHSQNAAEALGDLWELAISNTATIIRPQSTVASCEELKLDLSSWSGADLFRSEGYGDALFSQRARDWFTEHWGVYVRFEEFPTA